MKTKYLPFLTLVLPLLSHAVSPAELIKIDEARYLTALCSSPESERAELEQSLVRVKKRGKKGEFTAAKVLSDYDKAVELCSTTTLNQKQDLLQDLSGSDPKFPVEIMGDFQGGDVEKKNNEVSLSYLQSKSSAPCAEISKEDLYNNSVWHANLLKSGWECIANNYMAASQNINKEMNYGDSQKRLQDLGALSLPELKTLFKKTFKIGTNEQKLKIAFVPQLSWENGTLNTVIPYKFLTKPTELTSYRFLTKEMKKLGVQSTLIERNSLASLHEQVNVTTKKLLELDGPHMVISRSMGSRVVREIVAENNPEVNGKFSSWLNVGGTPHGSVIARAKVHPDNFYRGLVPSVVGAFKLPIDIISKDPRVASHIGDTLLSAIVRENLASLTPIQARRITESDVPVMNAVFVRNDFERAAPLIDPVWMHMLQYGPTEGSSPLVGAAVDTSNSMRLTVDSDHLAFWKYTPKEALAVFLRLMIVAEESRLNR